MERGELVPDEVTVGMLLERLAAPDAARGVILDGFPRTRSQAEALDRALAERAAAVEAALLVDVPADELLRRLSGRWLCEAAGHTYHEIGLPAARARRLRHLRVAADPARRRSRRPSCRPASRSSSAPSTTSSTTTGRAGVLQTVDGRRPIAAVTNDLLDCIEPVPYWRTHA